MVFLGILLHGICYDFFFVTGFIYTDKKCTSDIRGQAQGLLVLVTQGLGLGLGAQLVGRLVAAATPPEAQSLQAQSTALAKQAFAENDPDITARAGELAAQAAQMIDWYRVWLWPALGAAAVMVLFALLFWDRRVNGESSDVSLESATHFPEEAPR
jgi:hypothetical protein